MSAARRASKETRKDTRREDATRVVVSALRRRVDDGRFSADAAVETALAHLLRPGGPGARLGPVDRASLREVLVKLARPLASVGPMPRALLAFARDAVDATLALHREPRHPGVYIEEKTDGGTAALARAALWAESTRAKDDDDLVRRAVTRAVREKKRGRRGKVPVDVPEDDPLRAVLHLPARGRVWLPRNDLRAKIAGSSKGTAFGAALQQAARFAEEAIRDALGEELWALARPVGFADRGETKVLLEVTSSAAAHEAQLRQREFIGTLRTLRGLERVKTVKIVVVTPEVLPVVKR